MGKYIKSSRIYQNPKFQTDLTYYMYILGSRVVSRKSYFDKHLGKLQSKYNFDNDSNIVVMSKCCRNV